MFLKRQSEVSKEFSEYIAKNVLNSQRVWQSIIGGTKSEEFRRIIARNVPLPSGTIAAIITGLQQNVGAIASHPLHKYTDIRLNLQVVISNIIILIIIIIIFPIIIVIIFIYFNYYQMIYVHIMILIDVLYVTN